MTIDWTPLADLIETHDRFLVTTHVRPDGDALGSEVGMAGLLRQKGKDVRVVNSSPTPPRYDFLDPDSTCSSTSAPRSSPPSWPIARLPSSSTCRRGTSSATWLISSGQFPGPRVVIDHHVSEDDLGATFSRTRPPRRRAFSS